MNRGVLLLAVMAGITLTLTELFVLKTVGVI